MRNREYCLLLVVLTASSMVFPLAAGAANNNVAEWKESDLVAVIQSDKPAAEKAIACKRLVFVGTSAAVPALAALLPDGELTSWARTALEAIPGAEADAALRDALPKVQGRTLIGVINSIAVRRDARAADALKAYLKESDAELVAAAAVALGRIGGEAAARSLAQALEGAPASTRSSVAEGCVICAESLLAAGNRDSAIMLYDAVRKADVAKPRIVEATRGAIVARQASGLPLLVEQLRSPDKAMFELALRCARELKFAEVGEALVAELRRASVDRQGLIMVAMADRNDVDSLPVVLELARAGQTQVRVVAVKVLERLGNAACVPVLLEAAVHQDAALSQAAKLALARLSFPGVDDELRSRLASETGKTRQVLIELAGQRRIEGTVPLIVRYAEDADAGVRSAAVDTLGAIGDDKQAGDLAALAARARDARQREEIEKALMVLCGRWREATLPHVLPLAGNADPGVRITALHALACVGGSQALGAVVAAVGDKDAAVQDEAVRTLSTWPNRWTDDAGVADPLLSLARSSQKVSHQVLGLRGYLQYVRGNKKLDEGRKLEMIVAAMPAATRPEQKREIISVLGAINSAGSVQSLVELTNDPAVTEEACSAIVNLAGKGIRGANKQQRQQALEVVIAKSASENTRKRAEELLKANK